MNDLSINFYSLPNESLLNIFKFVSSPNDLLKLRLVSELFNNIIINQQIWPLIIQKKFNITCENSFNVFLYSKFMRCLPMAYQLNQLNPSGESQSGSKILIKGIGQIGLFNLTTKSLENWLPFPKLSNKFNFLTNERTTCAVSEDTQHLFIYDHLSGNVSTITIHFTDLKKIDMTDTYLIALGKKGEKEVFEIKTGHLLWMIDGKGNKIIDPDGYLSNPTPISISTLQYNDFLIAKDYMVWLSSYRDFQPKIYNLSDGSLRASIDIEKKDCVDHIESFALENDKLYIVTSATDLPKACGLIRIFDLSIDKPKCMEISHLPRQPELNGKSYSVNRSLTALSETLIFKDDILLFSDTISCTNSTKNCILDNKGNYKYKLEEGCTPLCTIFQIYNDLIIGLDSMQNTLLIWSKETGELLSKKTIKSQTILNNLLIINDQIVIQSRDIFLVIDFPKYFSEGIELEVRLAIRNASNS